MSDSYQMIDADTGAVLIPKLQLATSFWKRFRGLQFRRPLGADEGLLLIPCRSIHTHWMQFPIDVAMLNEDGVVLAILPALRPWRIARKVKGTQSVLETSAGVLAERIHVGVRTSVVLAGRHKATHRE